MKKLIALITLMVFAASLFCVPTVSLAAGSKSANYNLYTTGNSNYNTGNDVRGNDGLTNTSKNHSNRNAGDWSQVYYDLLTLDSRATSAGMEQRTEVPKYNKIVFRVNTWNTNILKVYHGTSINKYVINNCSWTEDREINSSGKNGEDCKAPLYQAFSFDATTDRYIGYQNQYRVSGSAFYCAETEVYYVTPNSINVTADSVAFVNAGDSFTATADVLDVDGDVINDSELNGIIWSVDSKNVTIDSKTGVVTIGSGFAKSEKITVTATSAYDNSITASKTITLIDKAADAANKSENYALNMPATSAWSGAVTNIVDGDYTTGAHSGRHSAGNWRTVVDMSSHDFVRYNKVVVTYSQYNTEYITIRSGSDSTVSNGLNVTKTLNLDHESKESSRQVISFDKSADPFIQLDNKYLHATNGTAADNVYYDKNPTICEFEVYYVKPVSIDVDVNNTYTVAAGSTVTPAAKVLDVDGDEIFDTELNGITWSVSGSDDVSIDSATGVVTVKNAIIGTQTVTLTATGYEGLSCSKIIKLTDSEIGKMEITGVSDFIMTNTEQSGSATFKPDVEIYAHNGSVIDGVEVVWSIENAPEGITLDDAKTGKFTVENTASGEFTLVCTPVSDTETVYAQKTIKLNNKVNVALGSIAWGIKSWGGASAWKVFDGDYKTSHSQGNHNGGSGYVIADLGEKTDANYMVVNFGNVNNSKSFRVAASNELSASAPAENGMEYESKDLPDLVPLNGSRSKMGTTLWSGRSNTDDAIDTDLEQKNIITENDLYTYLDTNLEDMRYVSFENYSIGATATYGVFGMREIELYNTAPNYVKINLPENVDISENDAKIQLTADVYNGLAKEEKASDASGVWNAQGFAITEDGMLSVPSTDEYTLGSITYSYVDENKLEAEATIYVCTFNGELKFSNTPDNFIDCRFENGLVEKNGIIYAPVDMDISEIYESITADYASIDAVMVTDEELNVIEEGEIVDGYTIYVISGDIMLSFALTTKSSMDVELTNAEGVYTAKCTLKGDVETATLVIAQYNGNELVSVDFDAKDEIVDTLTVSVSGVDSANTVKTMLIESIASMKPLK